MAPQGIVSFAQNFEDVMLWRALGDVADGFWIDVGAADPFIDSVTHAFSTSGWRGINIEPRVAGHARLLAARPRDINLCLALGAAPARLVLHQFEDGGLSTLNPAIAAHHNQTGRIASAVEVEVATLAEICRQYAPPAIHFLKIDVEGAERAVLEGADFTAFRPWIILLEATLPLSTQTNAEEWQDLVLAADYRLAWFDGLNRFYIAGEHWAALSGHFVVPPNLFDGFVLAGALGAASPADRHLATTGTPAPPHRDMIVVPRPLIPIVRKLRALRCKLATLLRGRVPAVA